MQPHQERTNHIPGNWKHLRKDQKECCQPTNTEALNTTERWERPLPRKLKQKPSWLTPHRHHFKRKWCRMKINKKMTNQQKLQPASWQRVVKPLKAKWPDGGIQRRTSKSSTKLSNRTWWGSQDRVMKWNWNQPGHPGYTRSHFSHGTHLRRGIKRDEEKSTRQGGEICGENPLLRAEPQTEGCFDTPIARDADKHIFLEHQYKDNQDIWQEQRRSSFRGTISSRRRWRRRANTRHGETRNIHRSSM